MKLASFGAPCLNIPRYAEVRKMLGERNQAKKNKLSLFVGSNAAGEQQLKHTVVGKSKKPRTSVSLNIERDLPVVYNYSKKAWFNSAIFSNGF